MVLRELTFYSLFLIIVFSLPTLANDIDVTIYAQHIYIYNRVGTIVLKISGTSSKNITSINLSVYEPAIGKNVSLISYRNISVDTYVLYVLKINITNNLKEGELGCSPIILMLNLSINNVSYLIEPILITACTEDPYSESYREFLNKAEQVYNEIEELSRKISSYAKILLILNIATVASLVIVILLLYFAVRGRIIGGGQELYGL